VGGGGGGGGGEAKQVMDNWMGLGFK